MQTYDFDQIVDRRGTNCTKWDGMKEVFGREDLTALWVADMDFKAPPQIIEALQNRVEHGIFGYTRYSDGWYDAFIDWVNRRHNWEIERHWITHSPGIVTAMALTLKALTEPGDSVVIQPPVYHHFEEQIRLNGREPVLNPLLYKDGRFVMDLDDLDEKLRGARGLLLCSPHNPAGRVWTEGDLSAVADLCLRHNVILISDEIHSDVVYSGFRHHPIASLSPEIARRSVTFMAPSKTFNIAGFKTSAVVIPDADLKARYDRLAEAMSLEGGTCMAVNAFEAAYRYGEPWLKALLRYLEGNLDEVETTLRKRIPFITLVRPEGTYVPLVDFRSLKKEPEALQRFLLDAGVAMNSGAMFGSGGEGFARLNIATPRALLREGLDKIVRAVSALR
ncbi:MAG: cystathionine beta-lyase [Dethiosulfovibrio peptidovorans]|nr:MAG: cystathionine beta-lyase [Dethiosulfovibrio peptidovorans]